MKKTMLMLMLLLTAPLYATDVVGPPAPRLAADSMLETLHGEAAPPDLTAYRMASLADAITTEVIVRMPGGREVNPLMGSLPLRVVQRGVEQAAVRWAVHKLHADGHPKGARILAKTATAYRIICVLWNAKQIAGSR